jgi:hypothetical protein
MENHNRNDTLETFCKVFLDEFLKASAIHEKFLMRPDGSSLYDERAADPIKAIEKLSAGKPERFLNILFLQLNRALIEWALEKMGGDGFKSRTEAALADFWNRAFFAIHFNPGVSLVEVARQTRLELPIKTPRPSRFPYHKLKEISETYEAALAAAKKIRGEHRRHESVNIADEIKEQWPDVSSATRARYANMRPTQIALDYTAWKHYPIGAESTKKIMNSMRVKIRATPPDPAVTKNLRELIKSLRERGIIEGPRNVKIPFRYPQDLIDRQLRLLKKNHK